MYIYHALINALSAHTIHIDTTPTPYFYSDTIFHTTPYFYSAFLNHLPKYHWRELPPLLKDFVSERWKQLRSLCSNKNETHTQCSLSWDWSWCVHLSLSLSLSLSKHTCTHAGTHTHTYAYTHAPHAQTHTHTHTHARTWARTLIYMYVIRHKRRKKCQPSKAVNQILFISLFCWR